MVKPDLDKLESIIDRLEDGDDIQEAELRAIAKDLEAGKQYSCATCEMYCTGEEIMVIYDKEAEAFIQIEVPMDESKGLTVSRAT